MRQEIVKGISTGLVPNQVVSKLVELGVNERHLTTIVNTGYSQYSNSLVTNMSSKLPKKTRFVYVGAYDSRTRDACVSKIEFGSRTRDEIISQFGDLNNEVWNCRHAWEQLSESAEAQGYEKDKS